MGFLQRGFAWGNKRGFAAKQFPPDLVIRLLSVLVNLIGGGGKREPTGLMLTSTPTLIGGGGKLESTELVLTDTETLIGGGGKLERTELVLTDTVVLDSGSYP